MTTQPPVQPAPASVAVVPEPIGFRSEGHSVGDSALHVLLVLVLLLGATLAVLVWAKRRGWLDRWITKAVAAPGSKRALQLEESLRLSPRTTVHCVRHGAQAYLVVESTGTARVLAMKEAGHGD